MTTTVNDDDRSTVQDISQRMQQMIDLQYEYMTTAETTITQTKATAARMNNIQLYPTLSSSWEDDFNLATFYLLPT